MKVKNRKINKNPSININKIKNVLSIKSKKRKIKLKLFIELIGIIFFSLILLLLLYTIIDYFIGDFLGSILEGINYDIYYFIVNNRRIVEYILLLIILGIIVYRFISKYVNSVNKLYESLNTILKEDDDVIKIPNDIYQFSEKLNSIKYNYKISKANQRDAEQKKNDLIMYMAHDLKTPLTSIIGYLTLLSDEKNISEELKQKYIKIALDKSLRVEELINQFFDITRYNLHSMPITKNKINISFLLEQLVDECYPMLEENNLNYELDIPEEVILNADGDKLARAFGNLLKNAINYSYTNSTIYISMKEENKKIIIKFRNKGDKIPKYKLDKIFDKFYRADDSRTSKTGGAGLGLAITKEIIELHKGSIKVINDDEYIEFYIELNKLI